MLSTYLRVSDESFVFTGHLMELYIPKSYYDTKLATNIGNTVNSFGLLYYRILDKSDKILDKGFLNLPIQIVFNMTNMEDRSENILGDDTGETIDYSVIKYYTDEKIMSTVISQNSAYVERFVKLMIGGKMDANIPYDKVIKSWLANMKYSGKNIGVPSVVLETLVSEIYRQKKNPDKAFRYKIGKDPKTKDTDYICFNARAIASRNSTFSAMTFEDMDSMITTSLNMNVYDKEQMESPIEKIIKM